jgi:hypothetical protein
MQLAAAPYRASGLVLWRKAVVRQARNLKFNPSPQPSGYLKLTCAGGHTRQDQLNSRSLAGFGIKTESAAQAIRYDSVDDVEAQTSTALIPAGREDPRKIAALGHSHSRLA